MPAIVLSSPTRTMTRVVVAARIFCVAAILGLSLATRHQEAIQTSLLLIAVALMATVLTWRSALHDTWIAFGEAVIAVLIVGAGLPGTLPCLIYLIVPPFAAGLAGGLVPLALVTLIQIFAINLLPLVQLDIVAANQRMTQAAAWLLTGVGSGVLGAWLREIGGLSKQDDAPYESARRLLGQLRTVARRLSAGLDPVGMAQQTLTELHDSIGDNRSVLLVRSEGGLLSPLAHRGDPGLITLAGKDPLVSECWTSESPVQQPTGSGVAGRRVRIALPLRVGVRIIGVVVADTPTTLSPERLRAAMAILEDHSLRLDTALAFDEVRTLATVEERHRLAREIHDGIAQEVASLGYLVDDLTATAESESQRERLGTLRTELTRVVSELRLSIFDLRAEITPTIGLGSVLSDYVRQVGARSGLTVHLSLDETPNRLRVDIETEMLRIAQEAITNARRHSGASNLWVRCRVDPPAAEMTIEDDGFGLGNPREDSFGLRIMRERAERVGGELRVQSRSPGGTIVAFTLAGPSADRVGEEPVGDHGAADRRPRSRTARTQPGF